MKLWAIVPELVLAGTCLGLVPIAGFVKGRARSLPSWLAGAALVVALAALAWMWRWQPVPVFQGAYTVDGFAHGFKAIILVGALLCVPALHAYLRGASAVSHAPVALLFATLAAVALPSCADLALFVLFLQMMSMALYVLVAVLRRSRVSLEAALKLFLYSAAALAISAYGFSLVYGLTGTLDLRGVATALPGAEGPLVVAAVVLVLVGFAFEATIVPFHVWGPDVYEGAPAPVTAFVSVVPKVAAFAALLRFLVAGVPLVALDWRPLLAVLAALTMTLGNLGALRQEKAKRLLAYSSIGHAGFVLMACAVAADVARALPAVGFHLVAYALMNVGAFVAVAAVERARGDDAITTLRGLSRTSPLLGWGLVLCLLSLAGIPPLGGFVGKVLLLDATLAGGRPWLALLAVANMVVSLWYYVKLAASVVLARGDGGELRPRASLSVVVLVCVVGLLLLGLLPGPVVAALAVLSL